MSRLKADLHIHSVLSACASLEMSPSKIIKQAIKKKLDIIAITDHNSANNCKVAVEIGKKNGIIVIPGIEVTVLEEFHVVTLFPDFKKAQILSDILYKKLLPININEDKMGYQIEVDGDENIIKFEKKLLNQATIPVDELITKVNELGGMYFFAHVDKSYFSVLASLGFIPPVWEECVFELTKENTGNYKKIIRNSDAHFLEDIGRRYFFIEAKKNIKSILKNIKNGVFFYDA
ncbi:MAG: PHP domain-containing protein [Candidatus Muirbacterium halophilum]|nr:PHP domain-containing protein [Candidatus Muirbacterium halophilum]MCK9475073.1 PHP domain-containing protein [Candidatus Muirbacterium halophilum]